MKKLSILRYLVLLGAVFGVFGLASPASAAVDSDGDSVSDVVENSSTPNSGDNNYDTALDSEQNTVATITNPNDQENPGAFVTLQVGETYDCGDGYVCEDSAWAIDEFKAVDVDTLPSQPDGKVFPVGLFDIKLSCQQRGLEFNDNLNRCVEYQKVHTEEGCDFVEVPIPAKLTLIFDRVMDTSNWTMEKYDPTTDTYIDYSPYVTISTQTIGYPRTVVEWTIFDGGLGDSDGVENGYISDPIGPSVPVFPATTSSVTEVKPAVATTFSGPALANTGADYKAIILAGIFLITSGAWLLPGKPSRLKRSAH